VFEVADDQAQAAGGQPVLKLQLILGIGAICIVTQEPRISRDFLFAISVSSENPPPLSRSVSSLSEPEAGYERIWYPYFDNLSAAAYFGLIRLIISVCVFFYSFY
jgi:hypothetical protein